MVLIEVLSFLELSIQINIDEYMAWRISKNDKTAKFFDIFKFLKNHFRESRMTQNDP